MVIGMGSKERRREYLDGVGEKRGEAAATRLKVDVMRAWGK